MQNVCPASLIFPTSWLLKYFLISLLYFVDAAASVSSHAAYDTLHYQRNT